MAYIPRKSKPDVVAPAIFPYCRDIFGIDSKHMVVFKAFVLAIRIRINFPIQKHAPFISFVSRQQSSTMSPIRERVPRFLDRCS